MTSPEQHDPLDILDQEMDLRAAVFIDQLKDLPSFDGQHEAIDPRTDLLRYLLRDFQEKAFALEDRLDPDGEHSLEETVLAYPSQPGDDMFALEHEHLTLAVEQEVRLWPLTHFSEDQAHYTSFLIDGRGRLFGIGSERLAETMHPHQRFMPIEVPMASIHPADAQAAHKALRQLWKTLHFIKNLPES